MLALKLPKLPIRQQRAQTMAAKLAQRIRLHATLEATRARQPRRGALGISQGHLCCLGRFPPFLAHFGKLGGDNLPDPLFFGGTQIGEFGPSHEANDEKFPVGISS